MRAPRPKNVSKSAYPVIHKLLFWEKNKVVAQQVYLKEQMDEPRAVNKIQRTNQAGHCMQNK